MSGTGAGRRWMAMIALTAAGLVLWGIAIFAVAQYTEDLCFDDLDAQREYGAYRATADFWPPSYECELLGSDVPPVSVEHRGVAFARLAVIVGFPVIYGALVVFVGLRGRQRTVDDPGSDVPARP